MAASGTDKSITAAELATAVTTLGGLATTAAVASGYQPLDSDLTAIAALTTTATGRSVLAAADDAAIRTIAGVGTIGTQASSSVSITGGSITGITDLAVADGGTGASTAADARTNLGLVIGTNVQAYDAELAAIAGVTSAADRVPYFTGSGTATVATFTAAGRALVDDADNTAQRTTLGLGTAATADSGAAAGNVLAVNTVNAKGDLLVATADNTIGVLTVGTNTHVLTADSAEATGVKWAAVSGSGSVATDTIWDANGDVVIGTGSNTATRLAVSSTGGQALIADPNATNLVSWQYPQAAESAHRGTTGSFASTADRRMYGSFSNGTTSGTLYMQGIVLVKGMVVTNITWFSLTQALVTGTNQWFALFDSSRNKLEVTADDTSTAWAANSAKTLALASPYTVTSTGWYYLGLCVVASTPPSRAGASSLDNASFRIAAPIVGGTSNTGLTNPASCPTTANAISSLSSTSYAEVS